MVEKITLIEPHLEGAQFGPEMNDSESERSTTDTSGSRKAPVFFLAVLIIGVVIGLARLRSNGGTDDSIEIQEKAKESLPWSR